MKKMKRSTFLTAMMMGGAAAASEFQIASFEPQQRFENQESHTYTFDIMLPVDPVNPGVEISITAEDPDFPDEGTFTLNDGHTFQLFGDQADGIYDEQVVTLLFVVPYEELRQGENTITITHTKYQYFVIEEVVISVMYEERPSVEPPHQLEERVIEVEAQLVELEERVGLLEGFINRLKAFFGSE